MLDAFDLLFGENSDEIVWWQMSIGALMVFFYAVVLYRIGPRRAFANLSARRPFSTSSMRGISRRRIRGWTMFAGGLAAEERPAPMRWFGAGAAWGVYSLHGRGPVRPLADTTAAFSAAAPAAVALWLGAWTLGAAPGLGAREAALAVASGALASAAAMRLVRGPAAAGGVDGGGGAVRRPADRSGAAWSSSERRRVGASALRRSDPR